MQIQILQIAATKDQSIKTLESEFEKRLASFAKIETITLPASKSDDREKAQSEEKDSLLQKINSDHFIIALDEKGKEMTSEEFANLLKEQRDFGPGKVQFLIGGSLASTHLTFSLSKMTFTHEMVRVFLKEQIYRAYTIIAGKRYHK